MSDFTYHQSDNFAVPIRDKSEIFIVDDDRCTTLDLDRKQPFIFLNPKKFKGETPAEVIEQVDRLITFLTENKYEVVISGKKDSLSHSISFSKSATICWSAELVIAGLR